MIDLSDYGYVHNEEFTGQDSGLVPARVTASHRERYEIISPYGEGFARLKAGVYYNGYSEEKYPTTGDFVLIQYNWNGDSLIARTLPRKSCFSRPDPDDGRGEQVVAANFDFVFILTSLNHDFNPKRLERYVTAAWQSGASPVVVLTKADLVADYQKQRMEAERVAIGVPLHAVSVATGEGLQSLEPYLSPGKTVVLLGSSGVGKSSLVNALSGSPVMTVSGIREDDSRGRHTTTHRQLIRLPNGGMIIDTPGMRELGMCDASQGLSEAFIDIEAFVSRCRFSDCRHQGEPGCAVRQAIESGMLDPERWKRYQKLKQEARFNEDRIAYIRERQQRHKASTRTVKKR